jgi:hypothetical protein
MHRGLHLLHLADLVRTLVAPIAKQVAEGGAALLLLFTVIPAVMIEERSRQRVHP